VTGRRRRLRAGVLDRLLVTESADPRGDRVLLWVAVRVPSRARWLRALVDDHRLDRAVVERARLVEALRDTGRTLPASTVDMDHGPAVDRLLDLHRPGKAT
jgi:hypothetical protein